MQLQSTQNSLALVEREKENLAIEVQLLRQQQQQQQRSKNTYFVNDDSDNAQRGTAVDSDGQLTRSRDWILLKTIIQFGRIFLAIEIRSDIGT